MGEIYVQLQESVRGCDVYLVQPTCPPANENLMELLIMIDACRRASAKNITAVIPYFGYARADRKKRGANRVLACDLHSGQSMGYFDIPVDHVYGQHDFGVCMDMRARAFAKKLSDAPLAIVDKRRHGHNVAEVSTDPPNLLCTTQVMNLIGDVKGKVAVMVDDMIDTAVIGWWLQELLLKEQLCCIKRVPEKSMHGSTHAVFSPPAIQRLSSGLFQEVIITNTIPVLEQNYFPQLTVLSVANLLGETIWRVHDDCSDCLISQQYQNFAWLLNLYSGR
ncbi:Ribose-phosphate pyrophosphokinase 1 [Vitis vinifera]|uniref:ribose-phosphate diphosphokinase n=1 Tax=Vitis vinifera TaxID=29760 RepID=A0A438J065_VITVI|nr:Ribose-phosphate pyrophosphokinase 1 [Vitis vinifera]